MAKMSLRECFTQIKEAKDRISEIQSACIHPETCVIKHHNASSGNYDPAENRTWTDFICSLCEKNGARRVLTNGTEKFYRF